MSTMAITRVALHFVSNYGSSLMMSNYRVRLRHNKATKVVAINNDTVSNNSDKVERKGVVAMKASQSAAILTQRFSESSLLPKIITTVESIKQWNLQPQMLIEKVYFFEPIALFFFRFDLFGLNLYDVVVLTCIIEFECERCYLSKISNII